MAGDWIKVEKATPRKPEVLRIADALQISIDQAFGLCVRFWMWCDDQMADGHALRVTTVTLDAVFGHAGFVPALIDVGWLRVRDGSLEVPNFDRHLSESAKNRALSGIRKKRQRSKSVTDTSRCDRDKNVTREEKRREENTGGNTNTPPTPTGEAAAPRQFVPPSVPDVLAYCRERKNTVDPQAFVDFYTSKGWLIGKTKMRDWRAAVRTWERNDDRGGRKSKSVAAGPGQHYGAEPDPGEF